MNRRGFFGLLAGAASAPILMDKGGERVLSIEGSRALNDVTAGDNGEKFFANGRNYVPEIEVSGTTLDTDRLASEIAEALRRNVRDSGRNLKRALSAELSGE